MAVETFFLMGFRAMSDMLKEIFPAGADNALAKKLNDLRGKDSKGASILELIQSLLRKLKDLAFIEKDLRFHIIKQLEPAFGHKIILNLEPLTPIAVLFNKNKDVFEVKIEHGAIKGLPGIFFPYELFNQFLTEDLDVLKLITENKITFENFLELDEIIVRALLGFTSAYFLRENFRERVKKELPTVLT